MSAVLATPQLPENTIIHGDSLAVLRSLPDACVDAIVTDPPAGISFMGKGWDSDKGGRTAWIAWLSSVMAEALRVLKPGGHALVWALPRTSHWTAMALEDAGFEVRDCVTHLFGSGFPKSLDVSKALDKRLGATRQKTGSYKGATNIGKGSSNSYIVSDSKTPQTTVDITAPATDAARAWDGWGTALKPAAEFWWLCRKPLAEGTIAGNVLAWGTGALNIGVSRIQGAKTPAPTRRGNSAPWFTTASQNLGGDDSKGRWPANLLLSHSLWCDETACALDCPIRALDAQSGELHARGNTTPTKRRQSNGSWGMNGATIGVGPDGPIDAGDTGGASRYFTTFRYTAKASRSERNRGCDRLLDSCETVEIQLSQYCQASGGQASCAPAQRVTLQVDTATSRPKVIVGCGIPHQDATAWSTFLFGNDTTAPFLTACKSITATTIRSTTASKTLNWLTRSLTSASIAAANFEKMDGGSPAASAVKSSPLLSFTSGETVSLPGVGPVPSGTLWRISASATQKPDAHNLSSNACARCGLRVKANGSGKKCECGPLRETIKLPQAGNGHPTVKPLALMSWLIGLITPPGGIVLDPFAGSGSTCVAAKEGGWRYLGIEREAEYVAIAQARLQAAPSLRLVQPTPKKRNTKKPQQPTLLEVSA